MTDNSTPLRRARQRDSTAKRQRANETLQIMENAGDPISFPAVAARAGVSVSFLYADAELARRIADVRDRQSQAGRDRSWRLPARSLVTQASLRTDLANAKEQLRRLTDEVRLLRTRLARDLGAQSDLAGRPSPAPELDRLEERSTQLEADNQKLRDRVAELEDQLRETNDTLESARSMNRELMAEINRPSPAGRSTKPGRVEPPATKSTPAPSRRSRKVGPVQ